MNEGLGELRVSQTLFYHSIIRILKMIVYYRKMEKL